MNKFEYITKELKGLSKVKNKLTKEIQKFRLHRKRD